MSRRFLTFFLFQTRSLSRFPTRLENRKDLKAFRFFHKFDKLFFYGAFESLRPCPREKGAVFHGGGAQKLFRPGQVYGLGHGIQPQGVVSPFGRLVHYPVVILKGVPFHVPGQEAQSHMTAVMRRGLSQSRISNAPGCLPAFFALDESCFGYSILIRSLS